MQLKRSAVRGWPAVAAPSALMALLASIIAVRTPLWRDELATLSFASLDTGDLFRATRHVDSVLLPFYAVSHLTHSLLPGDFFLRLPSIIASVVATAAVSLIALRWWGPVPGLLAGLAFALNPLTVQLAATARPYSLATCFVALAALALTRADGDTQLRGWLWYGLAIAAAGAMHLFALLTIPAFFFLARRDRRTFVLWLASTAAALLLVAPIAIMAYTQRGQVAWILAPTARSSVGAIASVLAYQVDGRLGPIEAAALGSLCIMGIVTVVLTARLAGDARRREFHRLGFVLGVLLLPWTLLLVYSVVVTPFLRSQYLAPTVLGFALTVGAGIARITPLLARRSPQSKRPAALLVAVVLAPMMISSGVTSVVVTQPWRVDDYPSLAAYLIEHVQSGDSLLVVQMYNEVGVSAGMARFTNDPGYFDELEKELPDGTQPRFDLRRVESVEPFVTSRAGSVDAGSSLWFVYTRGAFDLKDFSATGLSEFGCSSSNVHQVGAYGILRLAKAVCE